MKDAVENLLGKCELHCFWTSRLTCLVFRILIYKLYFFMFYGLLWNRFMQLPGIKNVNRMM